MSRQNSPGRGLRYGHLCEVTQEKSCRSAAPASACRQMTYERSPVTKQSSIANTADFMLANERNESILIAAWVMLQKCSGAQRCVTRCKKSLAPRGNAGPSGPYTGCSVRREAVSIDVFSRASVSRSRFNLSERRWCSTSSVPFAGRGEQAPRDAAMDRILKEAAIRPNCREKKS